MQTRVAVILLAVLAGLAGASAVLGQSEPAAYEIVDGGIPLPLTDQPGDPIRGELIARDAASATCLICHQMPIPDEPDPGNIGPNLAGVGSRFTAAALRLRLVDPKILNPDTVMPAYYGVAGLTRVQEQYVGQPIYSAQDIEDVVAFLMTLTEQ